MGTVMGTAVSKDKPQDHSLGQSITSLPTKQHPNITRRFGADKDSLIQERSVMHGIMGTVPNMQSNMRPATVPTGTTGGFGRGSNSNSGNSGSGSRGGFQPGLSTMNTVNTMGGTVNTMGSTGGLMNGDPSSNSFERVSVFQNGARSVVGQPAVERSVIIDISGTMNMIPKASEGTIKKKKGPKHLPGRTHNIEASRKRAQRRFELDTKADAAEVAALKKY